MLFIGRGFVLGLTGGQSILYPVKAREYHWFFQLGEFNAWGFNNQIPIALAVVAVGAFVLAKTRWGYETFATGGNEQAAIYAGIPTRWVRVRAYLLSSLCATIAGLMAAAQDKGISPAVRPQRRADRHRLRHHRRRLDPRRPRPRHRQLHRRAADRAHQQGAARRPADHPHRDDQRRTVKVQAVFSLPAGAVPAFIGVLLIVAVLIEPYHHPPPGARAAVGVAARQPPPPALDTGGVAIEGAQTKGAMATDKALTARGFGKFLARRDALAIILTVILWLVGLYLRPDYWWHLPNTFAILLNYTELALIAVGLDLCHRRRRHRPFGRRRAGACRRRRRLFAEGAGPRSGRGDRSSALPSGSLAGRRQRHADRRAWACRRSSPRSACSISRAALASWIVSGQQLTGFTESIQPDRPQGRRHPDLFRHAASRPGFLGALAEVVSVQTLWMILVSIIAGIVLAYMPFGQKLYATGGNIRAAAYAGINTKRVRFIALLFCALCATHGRPHQHRLFPQLQSRSPASSASSTASPPSSSAAARSSAATARSSARSPAPR